MNPLIIGLAVGIVFFLIAFVLINRFTSGNERSRQAVRQLMADSPEFDTGNDSIVRADLSGGTALRIIAGLPYGQAIGERILHAGMEQNAGALLGMTLFLAIVLPLVMLQIDAGFFMAFLAFAFAFYIMWWYLGRTVRKRNNKFISNFPDALDMIVRSVRSGFPLNTALNMVAENMQPPISNEFRQVVEEVALGRTLDEALTRLTHRIDETDVRFFVVVLKVQQETGGNLGEVINNLSNVIRKRKQLRLKIHAITSEGRTTAWILGLMPVVVFLAIYFMMPEHLHPLFVTSLGHLLLGTAITLIVMTQVLVRKMANVEI